MPSTAEAKKLWCPFSRVALSEGMAANRTASMGRGGYADIHDETRCLADGCAVWRWNDGPHPVSELGKPKHGYCGLAGSIR